MTLTPETIAELRVLLEKATPGDWQVQDSCSWRRIGTTRHDGDVLCPTYSRTDRHPDLMAGKGEDLYANLNLIVAMRNHMKTLLDDIERYRKALEEIAEGNIPRPIASYWRRDCKPCKHDQCEHSRSMWEDCGECVAAFARQALGGEHDR